MTTTLCFCNARTNPSPGESYNGIIIGSGTMTTTLYFCNVRSVRNKMADLRSLARRYDVIALNETWLNDKVPDSQLDDGFEEYMWFRCDRGSRGGGVACAIRKTMGPVTRALLNDLDLEMLVLKLTKHCVTIVVCYRPPNNREAITKIMDELEKIDGKLVVLGDFNISDIGKEKKSPQTKDFLKRCETMRLKQWVTVPTRGPNTLDLVLTRDIDLPKVEVQQSQFRTDHEEIICHANCLDMIS